METLNLNSLVAKNVKIDLKDEAFVIPQQPPMEFVLQFQELQEKAMKEKKQNKQLEFLIDVCGLILNQDESKNVTHEFLKKNLSLVQMKTLTQFYQEQISKIESDPN
jgi:hypothetical protein